MSETEANRTKRKLTTAPERERILKELEESGLGVTEFARSRAMAPETLYRWRSKRKRGSNPRGVGFLEVGVASTRPTDAMIVELNSEVRVHVNDPAQLDWVAALRTKLGNH